MSSCFDTTIVYDLHIISLYVIEIEKMDDEDTARSGFVDQDLRGVSKLNVPLRDPIDWFDPEEADVSIPLEA